MASVRTVLLEARTVTRRMASGVTGVVLLALVQGLMLVIPTATVRAETDDSVLSSRQFAESSGWYLGLGLGANYGQRSTLEGPDLKVDYDLGLPRYSGAIARRLGERWWLELSLSNRKTKAEFYYPEAGGPSHDPAPNDRFTTASLAASVLREFPLSQWARVYFGAGAGPAWITYELGEVFPGRPGEFPLIKDDTTALAVSATAGVRFPLTRSLDLGLAYEYWRTPDVAIKTLAGDKISLDQTVHSGWLGVYYYPGDGRTGGITATRTGAPSGAYVSGALGVGWIRDSDTEAFTFDAHRPGALTTFALGRHLGPYWQLEAEVALRDNEVQLIDFGFQLGERRVAGDLKSTSVGANLRLLPLPRAPIRPFVGFGAGVSWLHYDMRFSEGGRIVDDTVQAPYVQLQAGLSADLTRRLAFTTGWRVWYRAEEDLKLTDGRSVAADHWLHSVEFGLHYRIGSG